MKHLSSWWSGGAGPLGLPTCRPAGAEDSFGGWGSTDMTCRPAGPTDMMARWGYRHGAPLGLKILLVYRHDGPVGLPTCRMLGPT
jgi:hypothetical protein